MEPKTSHEGKNGVVDDNICLSCDGGGSHTEKEKAMKVEPIAKIDLGRGEKGGGGFGGGGGGGGWSGGLFRKPPPRFLTKTFEMVEDPKTNELISWSITRKSLIIWDHLKFSKDLLPKHFRHNNFSSFVYQLNIYGFKKIDSDQFEYANPWFQADKKHLLSNIKRRTPYLRKNNNNNNVERKRATTSSSLHDFAADGSAEAELQKLKNNQNTMEIEISKVKQRMDTVEHRLAAMDKCIESTNVGIKQEVFMLVANAIANPSFHRHFVEHPTASENEQRINRNMPLLKLANLNKNRDEPIQTIKSEEKCDSTLKSDENSILLAEKLLEDDFGFGYGAEDQMGQRQSRIVLELEDLIPKPPDWSEYAKELMEQSGDSISKGREESKAVAD